MSYSEGSQSQQINASSRGYGRFGSKFEQMRMEDLYHELSVLHYSASKVPDVDREIHQQRIDELQAKIQEMEKVGIDPNLILSDLRAKRELIIMPRRTEDPQDSKDLADIEQEIADLEARLSTQP